jgi:hypothetical protein
MTPTPAAFAELDPRGHPARLLCASCRPVVSDDDTGDNRGGERCREGTAVLTAVIQSAGVGSTLTTVDPSEGLPRVAARRWSVPHVRQYQILCPV